MSEPRKHCQICKDPLEDNHHWTCEDGGVVHFECHLKAKLSKAEADNARLIAALKEAEVALDRWHDYFQSNIPVNVDEHEAQGEAFTTNWYGMINTLATINTALEQVKEP